jgi:hypothetical protein
VLRHGFTALLVLALVAPLTPAAGDVMACCHGTGEACVCPRELGFSRCETAPEISPPQTLPAVLSPGPPALTPSLSPEAPFQPSEELASFVRRPLIPPPRV